MVVSVYGLFIIHILCQNVLVFCQPAMTTHSMWCLPSQVCTNGWLILTPLCEWQMLVKVSGLPTHNCLENVAVWLMLSDWKHMRHNGAWPFHLFSIFHLNILNSCRVYLLTFQFLKFGLKELSLLSFTISVQHKLLIEPSMLNNCNNHDEHFFRMCIIYIYYDFISAIRLGIKLCSYTSGDLWHCFLYFKTE